MTLEALLSVVQEKFGDTDSACYQFHLGRIAGVWRFAIVNSWNKWLERKLQYQFDGGTPQAAVAAFLAYIEAQKIDLDALMEPRNSRLKAAAK